MALLQTSVWVILLAALASVCAALWPANLGGRTTFVSTHGTSMIPRFHAGDLAVVQPASTYHVGDIAAYRSTTLHGAVVLHRIVEIRDGHFTFKGDNNDFRDPDHPTAAQVVGKLRLRIPHGGAIRGLLARPLVLFPLLALVFGGFAKPWSQRSRRRRERGGARARSLGNIGVAAVAVGALATSGAVFAAVAVWRLPPTQAATTAQPFRATATLGYSGAVPRGAVYPDGRLHTGDPVFTRLIRRVKVDLDFAFAGTRTSTRLQSTSQVVADFSSATGWHRTLVLSPRRPIAGDHVRAAATLDLEVLRRIQNAFTAQTGLTTPDASLRITWQLHVGGTVAGAAIGSDLSPHLDFQLTPVELVPSPAATSDGTAPANGSVSKTGSVAVASVRPRTFGVWGLRCSDALARWLSIALIVATLVTAAALLLIDRRRVARGGAASTMARYRAFVVNVDAIPPVGRRPVVHVHTMRDLTRLAKLHEEFIVHAADSGTHRFALLTESVVYVHDIASAPRPTPAADDHDDDRSRERSAGDSDGAEPGDLARWALAGLEACAAERRSAQRRRHLTTLPGIDHSRATR